MTSEKNKTEQELQSIIKDAEEVKAEQPEKADAKQIEDVLEKVFKPYITADLKGTAEEIEQRKSEAIKEAKEIYSELTEDEKARYNVAKRSTDRLISELLENQKKISAYMSGEQTLSGQIELRALQEKQQDLLIRLSVIQHVLEDIEESKKVVPKRADKVDYPLDKFNANVWNNLTLEESNGQIRFNLTAETDKTGKPVYALYSINFDDLDEEENLHITKRLEPFDKRVYIAISSLYKAGNKTVTLTQVHYAIGNTKRPSKKQLENILNSVKKMRSARIHIDNEQESTRYKKIIHFQYDDYLLPVAFISADVNGQFTDGALKIRGEPPLITFARQRKQLSTISQTLLQSPISKTDANLMLEDYLLNRILRAKHGKKHTCKLLYSTIYEKADISTKMQKKRAPQKIEEYLLYYKKIGFISKYKAEQDGITICWN